MLLRRLLLAPLALALVLGLGAVSALATDDEERAREDRLRQLERKVDLLTDELSRARQDSALPENAELESEWGLGPAASKVYGVTRGLSIGGYAEATYTAIAGDKRASGEVNRFDFVRTVLYTGYKFTDHLLFNAELEFEHATTSSTESSGSGSVSVEFAALDFLIRDEANARVGLLLVPMGFLNELHEPPFFYGTQRPEAETRIIPSTWRENGAGLFGRVAELFEYKLYAITSLNAAGFGASGLRGGRQKGNRALAEHMGFVGRVDFEPTPELLFGGSVFVGNTGQDQDFDVDRDGDGTIDAESRLPDARLLIYEAHAQLRTRGLHARGLFTMAHLDEARGVTRALRPAAQGGSGDIGGGEVIADTMIGLYGEVAYEVMQWIDPDSGWSVDPFFRYEWVDTQHAVPGGFGGPDRSREFQVYTVGIQAKPIPNVVLKLDYRNRVARRGELGDEINAGIGLVF